MVAQRSEHNAGHCPLVAFCAATGRGLEKVLAKLVHRRVLYAVVCKVENDRTGRED